MVDAAATEARQVLAARLLDVLRGPSATSVRQNAARLLRWFAGDGEAAALAPWLLERGGDPWVRTFVLRAFGHRRLGLPDEALVALCAELLEVGARGFAVEDDLGIVAALATTRAQERIVADVAARWQVVPARPANAPRPPASPPHREALARGDHEELARLARDASLAPEPAHRELFGWALRQAAPALRRAGLRGLVTLDAGRIDPAELTRQGASEDPLSRLLVLECRLAGGDGDAALPLTQAARHAPDVLVRAQALRSLRAASPPPTALFQHAVVHDREIFDGSYMPAVSEAALGLARRDTLDALTALDTLVTAYLDLDNDDAPWAIESAIASWIDGTRPSLRPVWYALRAD